MATRAANIRLHKVKQGGWTVVERHQTRPSCFAGVRGKKESIWREDRAEREVIYGTLRCILDQPWDDDDSRSGGWQANKSWLTVWEPLPICCSLRVWGMPSVKPLLPWVDRRVTVRRTCIYNSFSFSPNVPARSLRFHTLQRCTLGPPPACSNTKRWICWCRRCILCRCTSLWIHHTLLPRGGTMYLG